MPLGVESAHYRCGVIAVGSFEADIAEFAAALSKALRDNVIEFAFVFFSQDTWPAETVTAALSAAAPGLRYAGCSTAGELAPCGIGEHGIVAILFPAGCFNIEARLISGVGDAGMGHIVSEVASLRHQLEARTQGAAGGDSFAISLIDGMSYAEESITSAIHWGLDDIPLIGGSAGDNLRFEKTRLVLDGQVHDNGAIVVLVHTTVPFHVFKTDNFVPTRDKLVVTASDPDRRIVYEFNAGLAANEYAAAIGIDAATLTPQSFASHPLVVRVGGEYFCRSIQKMNPDGSLSFFCAIDDGVVLTVAEPLGMVESTRERLKEIATGLNGIDFVLGFDCVLRRLDARNRQVIRKISDLYEANHVIGFGTYGEQYRSMHLNQTLTGIAFGAGGQASP